MRELFASKLYDASEDRDDDDEEEEERIAGFGCVRLTNYFVIFVVVWWRSRDRKESQ